MYFVKCMRIFLPISKKVYADEESREVYVEVTLCPFTSASYKQNEFTTLETLQKHVTFYHP